jgi:phosphatidylinositol glycan class K
MKALYIFLTALIPSALNISVQAQGAATKRKRTGPALLNSRHESTIRNILLPKFTKENPLIPGNHTWNVAVIVSSSRYWFNYRHVTNALSIYRLLKRGGITDDNIVLMLADDIPCNMRNIYRGKIFSRGAKGGEGEDLMKDVEIDYSGTDVTVDAFLRVLLGRPLEGDAENDGVHRRSLPKMDENTNVLVYLTGHGGDNFFKFQDGEELMSSDVASAFSQMYHLKRYKEILFISDTCQAFTMADEIVAPNVYSVGSSLKGQNSYASHTDTEVGQSVIDRYLKVVRDFLDDAVVVTADEASKRPKVFTGSENVPLAVMERLNLHDVLVRVPTMHGELGNDSKVGFTDRFCSRSMNKVPLSDFFAIAPMKREKPNKQNNGLVASLWMENVALPSVSYYSTNNRECMVESESIVKSFYDTQPKITKESLSYDFRFFAMLIGFFAFIFFSFNAY